MGKAGQSLREVLETYGISQNKLSVTMGVGRSTIHYWFNETSDPSAESVLDILKALKKINPDAAKAFIQLYLEELDDDKE